MRKDRVTRRPLSLDERAASVLERGVDRARIEAEFTCQLVEDSPLNLADALRHQGDECGDPEHLASLLGARNGARHHFDSLVGPVFFSKVRKVREERAQLSL